ncbi:arsenate reductase ArsC, partial [Actinomadura sp. 7K534]|uniref:arsenate reductase ArsC n=1 Tax=Actinomadura sp. 7K534 TaxID=2530366 RepID=UPI001046BE3E
PSPPAPREAAASVLFACTGNSARSPIAEALLRRRTGGRVEVTSAGSHPKPRLHPAAVRVLSERYGIDVADRRPRRLDDLADRGFTHVISLCDKVREVFPDFGDHPRRIHWSIPDPAAVGEGPADEFQAAFARTAAEIDARIGYLIPRLAQPEQEIRP